MHILLDSDNILLVMKNVVQSLIKFKKETAIELRKKGFSYSEIQKKIKTPKSTLSFWLKTIQLTDYQIQKLKDKRKKIAKENSENRSFKIEKQIEEIKNSSAKDVGQISKRELWLMGIILYWLRRNKNDARNGVMFASSEPELIKLFLKWLKQIGGITEEEIKFDIFLKKKKAVSDEAIRRTVRYWSFITDVPKERFLEHIYFQKEQHKAKTKDEQVGNNNNSHETPGFLRIRIRASSMLARQISGWVRGIINATED